MKRILVVAAFVWSGISAFSQISLDELQLKARQNYPQINQLHLIDQATDFTLSNASKSWLPQVSLSGKATYQSDAMNLSLNLPGGTAGIHQSKDQYQVVAELQQQLWDGGVTSAKRQSLKTSAEVEKQKLEVDLYALRDRVNQLFFGLLLLQAQDQQAAITESELQTNIDKIKACKINGVANQSDLDLVRVEILNIGQRRIELQASAKAYRTMLSALTGVRLDEKSTFSKPAPVAVSTENAGQRPEVTLISNQIELLNAQDKMENAQLMPKFGFFLQSGYGKPGLNLLNTDFSPFYIGGVRFSWNLGALYTHRNNRLLMSNSKAQLNTARETFLFNTGLKITQQQTDVDKLTDLITSDDEILNLRTRIKKTCSSKLDNGVATVNDLLREIHAESLAREQKTLHEIQLQLMQETIRYSLNN